MLYESNMLNIINRIHKYMNVFLPLVLFVCEFVLVRKYVGLLHCVSRVAQSV